MYFDAVAVGDFEMERAGGLKEGASVAFKGGMLEAEEIRVVGRLGPGEPIKQDAGEADLFTDIHTQTVLS